MKTCNKCGVEFPITSEFWHIARKNTDGFMNTCKICRNAESAQRMREKYRTKEGKEKVRLSNKNYYQNNREKVDAKNKLWIAANLEYVQMIRRKANLKQRTLKREEYNKYQREYSRRYRATEKGRMVNNISRYKHQIKFWKGYIQNDFTADDWLYAKAYFEDRCAYCGRHEDELELDVLLMEHMTPLYRTADFTKYNIVPACRSCNASKGRLDLEQYKKKIAPERYDKIIEFIAHLRQVNNIT